MKIELLTQFLLWQGYLDVPGLMRLLAYQEQHARSFGDYAVAFGYLSEEQRQAVRSAQLQGGRTFGETARSLELMSESQVKAVVRAQANDRAPLGQALEALGLLSAKELERATLAFMHEQTHFAELAHRIPPEVRARKAIARAFELYSAFWLRMWGIRTTPEPPYLELGSVVFEGPAARVVFSGSFTAELLVAAPWSAAEAGIRTLLGTTEVLREETRDLVREFLNVVAGHLTAALSSSGEQATFGPPQSVTGSLSGDGRPLVVGRFHSSYGTLLGMIRAESA